MPNDRYPTIDARLLQALDVSFPDRCPDLDASEREVWAAVGRAEVVRFLRFKHEEQNETLYEEET